MHIGTTVLCAAMVMVGCRTLERPAPNEGAEIDADDLAQKLIIADGHVDLPYRLRAGVEKTGYITEDVTQPTESGDFDWPRARAGGLDAPFMSIYVPSKYQSEPGRSKAVADELIEMVEDLARRAPDKFSLARTPKDIQRLKREGKIALPMGIENGSALEDDLKNIAYFHGRGIRYITLTHDRDNKIADSSYDDRHTWGGLSDFGRKVVREMAHVGIMVDVSHVTDDGVRDILEISPVPAIASHSSCRHFTPGWPRNLPDELITALSEKGGVVLINFGSSFLSEASRTHFAARRRAQERFIEDEGVEPGGPEVEMFVEDYDRRHPMVLATVKDVADHIDHVVNLTGIDHVGLGSDFDGVGPTTPLDLKDASMYPNLFRELLSRKYTEEDIRKIASDNLFRVWKAVESFATLSQAH